MAIDNAKDIAAIGFDPRRTYIFTDMDSIDMLYPNVLRIQRQVTCSQVRDHAPAPEIFDWQQRGITAENCSRRLRGSLGSQIATPLARCRFPRSKQLLASPPPFPPFSLAPALESSGRNAATSHALFLVLLIKIPTFG